MPPYRSRTSTHGRNMAGARGLWRATGMRDGDFKQLMGIVEVESVLEVVGIRRQRHQRQPQPEENCPYIDTRHSISLLPSKVCFASFGRRSRGCAEIRPDAEAMPRAANGARDSPARRQGAGGPIVRPRRNRPALAKSPHSSIVNLMADPPQNHGSPPQPPARRATRPPDPEAPQKQRLPALRLTPRFGHS